jgi:threonine/homoserine/homoserine lactone efflux protein
LDIGMDTLAIFASSLLIGFSGAASPGPLLVFTIRETVVSGLAAPLLIIAGHALLELVAVVGLTAGLTRALNHAGVAPAIGLAGGAVMLFLAWGTFRDATRSPTAGPRGGKPPSHSSGYARLFGLGILVSLSNPYWTVWWLTIGSSLMASTAQADGTIRWAPVAAFYTGHILADFAWYLGVGIAVIMGKRFIEGRAYRYLLMGLAFLLALFGVYFLWKSSGLMFG